MIYIQYIYDINPLWKLLAETINDALRDDFECCYVSDSNFWNNREIGSKDVLICFTMFYDYIANSKIENKIKTLIINTECLYSDVFYMNRLAVHNFLKVYLANKDVSTVIDCQSKNMVTVKSQSVYDGIKHLYLPLTYNNYFEEIYKKYAVKDSEKDIDILMYGTLVSGNRRITKINELVTNNVKVYCVNVFKDLEEQIRVISRSKIVLNLYFYENSKSFDYYRITFLLSNKVFTIYEDVDYLNEEFDKKVMNYRDYVVTAKYENILETVKKCLSLPQEKRDEMTEKAYEWYKNSTNYKEDIVKVINTMMD